MCRIDAPDLDKVPKGGPLIAYANHTGQIEVPLLYAHLQPRPLKGLAKVETWDNWFLHWVFNLWEAIPLKRGEADMTAIRMSLEALKTRRNPGHRAGGYTQQNRRSPQSSSWHHHAGFAQRCAPVAGCPLGWGKLPEQPEAFKTDRFPHPRGRTFQA